MNSKISKNLNKLVQRSSHLYRLCHQVSNSTNAEINLVNESKSSLIINRNRIFNEQLEKQRNAIGRINKIEVKVVDCKPHPNTTMLMNKDLSTPLDCARHISELYSVRSVIASVNGEIWDMFRPLEKDCTLKFHHFNEEDTFEVNKAFWRSCSFLLGKVISNSFKDDVPFYLHSWPKPNFKSGSFIYDVQLPTLDNWQPRESELLTLTKGFWKLKEQRLPFERLQVPISIGKELFKDNPFKTKQLELIESKNENSNITLYRVGKFIDFSIGPMIPNTELFGKVNVTAVHQIKGTCGKLYRFQGCALPSQLPMHFYSYNILLERAKQLSLAPVP